MKKKELIYVTYKFFMREVSSKLEIHSKLGNYFSFDFG